MQLKGVYTAIITPFDPEGRLDEQGFRELLRYQVENEVNGIVVSGTTGEAPTLSSTEKEHLIRIAVEEVKGKTTLMVGTGSYSTEQTLLNTQKAKDLGADCALVITPYYNRPTQEGLYRHFSTICEKVEFPICLYNAPGRTGQNLEVRTLERLISSPWIVGMKESSNQLAQAQDTITLLSSTHVSALTGDDAWSLPFIALGGQGVISVVSNLYPKAVKQLVDAALKGNFEEARHWHNALVPMFKGAFLETNPGPIKAAMQVCGMPSGPCRLPLSPLTPENLEKIKTLLQTLPLKWLGQYGQTQSPHR